MVVTIGTHHMHTHACHYGLFVHAGAVSCCAGASCRHQHSTQPPGRPDQHTARGDAGLAGGGCAVRMTQSLLLTFCQLPIEWHIPSQGYVGPGAADDVLLVLLQLVGDTDIRWEGWGSKQVTAHIQGSLVCTLSL